MTVKIPSSAADVRTWALANTEGFSPEALATVQPGSRGRIAPEIRKAFNKSHRHNPYVESERRGRTTPVPVPTADKNGRVRTVVHALPAGEARGLARDLGLVGEKSRGRYGVAEDGFPVLVHLGAALAKL